MKLIKLKAKREKLEHWETTHSKHLDHKKEEGDHFENKTLIKETRKNDPLSQ